MHAYRTAAPIVINIASLHLCRQESPHAVQCGLDLLDSSRATYGTPGFVEEVESAMRQLGLESYQSSFFEPSSDLFEGWPGKRAASPTAYPCTNLHGILRSRRGDGKEAIVIVTPMQLSLGSAQGGNNSSEADAAALLLGAVAMLAGHLGNTQWLAKDLVWVVPDARCGSLRSLQHWVSLYQPQQLPSQSPPGQRFGRAGVMQQAVVLEATSGAQYDSLVRQGSALDLQASPLGGARTTLKWPSRASLNCVCTGCTAGRVQWRAAQAGHVSPAHNFGLRASGQ